MMIRALKYVWLFTALALFYGFSAQAAETAAEADPGALKLKSIFENFINYQKSLNNAAGPQYQYEGTMTVEKADGYYAVTLPHARVMYPDGRKLDIGMVSLNASPHDQPGQWKMTLAVPTPIVMYSANQVPETRVNIGGQRAVGIWDEKLENFYKLDADYKDLSITGADAHFNVKIPAAQIRYDFSQNDKGQWSGPAFFALNDVDMTFAQAAGTLKIGQAQASFNMDGYNPAALKRYREQITALLENSAQGAQPSPAHTAGITNMIFDFVLKSANGFKGNYSVTNVALNKVAQGENPAQSLTLASGAVGLDIGGLTENKANLGLTSKLAGFAITSPAPAEDEILPTDTNIDISVMNIPVGDIAELIRNNMQSPAPQQQGMAQLMMLQMLIKIPALLSQSGTYAMIEDNYIIGKDYRFDISGRVRADLSAVNSATIESRSTFKGLDGLISKVEALAANPAHKLAPRYQELAKSLKQYKTYARTENTEGGEPVYVIDILMNPQGQILLNGQDAKMLMINKAPGEAPAAAPVTPVEPVTPVTPPQAAPATP